MCFGTPKSVKKAAAQQVEIARQQQQEASAALERQKAAEAEREANIRQGEQSIGNAFSAFNDNYFNGYKDSLVNASMPDLTRQYNEAKDTSFSTLAGRGVLDSSYGNQVLGGIERQYGDSKANIASAANDAANMLRQKVDSSKAGMYALNTGSTDPGALAAQAYGSATSLAQIQPQSLSDQNTFGAFLTPLLSYMSEKNRQITPVSVNNGGTGRFGGSRAVSIVK